MISRAKSRFVRISSRKVKLVIDLVRGKNLEEAFSILKFTRKAAAMPVRKLVQSAYSNAVNQLGSLDLDTEEIIVKKIVVEQGPTLKRWRARAMGRATPILKRTSHITVELDIPEPEEEQSGVSKKK
jgi:large subunit ribosomal protein L22